MIEQRGRRDSSNSRAQHWHSRLPTVLYTSKKAEKTNGNERVYLTNAELTAERSNSGLFIEMLWACREEFFERQARFADTGRRCVRVVLYYGRRLKSL